MATVQAHSDFLPPPSPGSARALALALVVHGLLVLAHGLCIAGLVCVRTPMPVYAGGGAPRDQLLALPLADGGLSVWPGLSGGLAHLSHHHCADGLS